MSRIVDLWDRRPAGHRRIDLFRKVTDPTDMFEHQPSLDAGAVSTLAATTDLANAPVVVIHRSYSPMPRITATTSSLSAYAGRALCTVILTRGEICGQAGI